MSSSGDPESSLSWTRDGHFVARTKGNRVVIADARNGFLDVASLDTGGYVRCIAFCTTKDKSNTLAVVNTAGYLFVLELTFADSNCTLGIKHSSFIEENLWVVAWSSGEFFDAVFFSLADGFDGIKFLSSAFVSVSQMVNYLPQEERERYCTFSLHRTLKESVIR
jgi:hypothetical protein